MSKTLVSGGCGFIGSHLVDRLIKEGHEVTVIDDLSTGHKENLNNKARFIRSDVAYWMDNFSEFASSEYVFHLAALPRVIPSINNPILTNHNNVNGTLGVLMAAKECGVIKRVIFMSSSAIYGNSNPPSIETNEPDFLNPYALTKYFGEQYCRLFTKLYGIDTVSLRGFNIYGNRMDPEGDYATAIAIFMNQKAKGEPMTIIGDGEQRRDFIHVDDVVDANIMAMKKDKDFNGDVINIGYGKSYSINELTKMIGGKTVNIPEKKGEARETLADITRAAKYLDWSPKISLKDGLKMLDLSTI